MIKDKSAFFKAGGRLGLVFSGGEGPAPERCRALFEEARGEAAGIGPSGSEIDEDSAPLIIAADSGLLLAEAAGIRPGWVIGDMDSLEETRNGGRLAAYPPERVLRYPADKDFTDTELALSFLFERGCSRYWIIGGGGGRIDHLFAIRSLFERERPPERWLTADCDIRCIGAAAPALPENLVLGADGERQKRPVSLFPLGEGPWEAESRGLRWPLNGYAWGKGLFAISNEADESGFSIKIIQGRFMVILF